MGRREGAPTGRQQDTGQAANPISRAEVDAQLRDILDSEFFVHSDRLRRLLEFVVEQSLAGNRDDIKEYSIGLAVFDRSPNYDPRIDPIVRVEAGRLRTRLKQFYTSPQGSAAPIIIDLPKGSYFAAVHRREDLAGTEPPAAALPHRPWLYLLAGALLVLAVLTAFLLVSNHALRTQIQAIAPLRATQQVASVWGPVVSSEGETVVIFGSPLFYESEKEYLFVRPYSLPSASSAADSAQFQRLRKQLSLLPDPRYEYAQIGDATALHRLGQFLGKYGVRSKAVPAHLATWESIKDCNIICVGAERMIPLLQRLPVQLDFSFRPDFDVDNRNPRPGEPQKYSTPSHRDAMSYAVIAKGPGLRRDRGILIFASHGSAGTDAAVEYLTSRDTINDLAPRLSTSGAGGYQVLLKVLADRDQAFKTEYVTHHESAPPPVGR